MTMLLTLAKLTRSGVDGRKRPALLDGLPLHQTIQGSQANEDVDEVSINV